MVWGGGWREGGGYTFGHHVCGCTKDMTEWQGEFRRGRARRGLGEGKQAVFGKNALSFFKRKKNMKLNHYLMVTEKLPILTST